MHRLARIALLCTSLAGVVGTTTGCPAFIAALPTVLEGVSDATLIIQQIETFVSAYFAAHPDAAAQAKVTTAITAVRDALITAERTLAGAGDVTSANVAAAFSNFTEAYNALMTLVADIGVKTLAPGALPTATRGVLFVPEPQLCHLHPAAARRAQ